MNPMETDDVRGRVARYVRRWSGSAGREGSAASTGSDEPSGSDTWHALSILDLLQEGFEDEATVAYLRRTQHPDGSYDSVYAAYYAIKSLALLGERPSLDPRPYVTANLDRYGST